MADEAKLDFFVSYNSADAQWAEWIAWQLKEKNFTVSIQAWHFGPGTNFVEQMQHATATAERTIAVLSQSYLDAKFTHPEWQAAFRQDPTGEKGKLLPVRVGQCDPLGVLGQIVCVDLVDLEESAARERLLQGINLEPTIPNRAPGFPKQRTPAPAFPGSLPPVWNVPHRNRNFTGREDLLEDLAAKLESGEAAAITQAIHGLGGIGKTQLAIEFAYRHASSYEVVWWLAAETTLTLGDAFARLAVKLELTSPDADLQSQIDAARHWLEHHGEWLLIFDNAADAPSIRDYLPRGESGRVVITSRNPNWQSVAEPFTVRPLPREESVQLLARLAASEDRDSMDQLAHELGDLPLALSQAGGYISTVQVSAKEYLDLYTTRRHKLWEQEPAPDDYQATIATTWSLAIEKLSQPAVALLRLCSFFDSEGIPRSLLSTSVEGSELLETLRDPLQQLQAAAELRQQSLMELADDDLAVHRLVQTVVRDELGGRLDEWAKLALGIVDGAFKYDDNDPRVARLMSRLVPHGLAAIEHVTDEAETVGKILINFSGSYRQLGRHPAARGLLQRAIEINEQAFEKDHPRLATSYSNLALVEQDLGNLDAARSLLQRAIEIQEQAFDKDHPALAISYSNLGLVEKDLGNLNAARGMLQRAIKIWEQAFDKDHPTLATSYSNLALVEKDLGNLDAARSLLQRAIEIDEQGFDKGHPTLAIRYSNLALVEKDLGNLDGARGLLQRAIEIQEQAFDKDHPALAISYSNLAVVEKDLGNLNAARGMLQRAIEIWEQAFDKDHPTLATSYSNLAVVERDLGNLDAARSLLQRAIKIDEQAFDKDHPTLATSYSNLATVETAAGNLSDAVSLMRQAHRIWQSKLGDEHSITKRALEWLSENDSGSE